MKPSILSLTSAFRTLSLGAVSLGAVLFWQTASATSIEVSAEKQASLGFQSAVVEQVSAYPGVTYPGEAIIPPNQTFLVTAPLSGLVTKIIHIHGPITTGEVIAELQSPELLNAQKNYLNTLSDLQAAQSELNRAAKLMKTGVVSAKKYQLAEADLKKIRQIQRQQRQDLALLGMAPNAIDALEKSHKLQPAVVQITAPVDGELFDLQIRVGQRLTTNQAIISIGQIEPIVVESRVPLQAANQLSLKQKAQLVSLDLVGEIEYIPNFSDPMTQTMNVHIEFTNENHQLRPGQLVTLSFLFEAEPNTPLYVIPRGAISRYDGQDVVYLRQDTRIQVLPIEVKNITGDRLYFTTAAPLPANAELLIESTAAVKGLLETAEGGE